MTFASLITKGGLLVAIAVSQQVPSTASLYASARQYDKTSFRFEPPPVERTEKMQALATSLTAAALAGNSKPPARAVTLAHDLGLELVSARDAQGPVWVLREADSRRAGDGFFVWRPDGAPVCLEAPHTFFDERTGDIALALMAEVRAVALFTNTVHRYSSVVPGADVDAADVAHASRSLFAAATVGLLAARTMPIVQVHGFGPSESLPPDTAAVVSDGATKRSAGAPAERLRAALQGKLAGRVLLFGVDAHELGATVNVEGRAARAARAPFLHVEMSRAAREAAPTPALARALREALKLAP